MTPDRDIFSISGPVHLTAVDWSNPHHRRSVAGSLVQGVYIVEFDRQQKRTGSAAEAPPWWNFFNFEVNRLLIDEADNSIFGVIYEFKSLISTQNIPRYVIAFRGTLLKLQNMSRDFKLDIQCIRNTLDQSSRFQQAMQTIQETINLAGSATNVWLAGHSLGSAVALLAGKNMVKIGFHIETYLFNPPFLSLPLEKIKSQKLKNGIRFTTSIVKAGLSAAVKGLNQKIDEDDLFLKLSAWTPFLFVNPVDPVCQEYIGYFEHRKKMEDIGAWKIESIATQSSLRGLFSDSEPPLHLLPSAYMEINSTIFPDLRRAHGIHQWWDPEYNVKGVHHKFIQ